MGTCAQRGPWSRLGTLAVRASLVGGLCIGGWLSTTAVAAATEPPEIDRPRIEVEQPPVQPIDKTDQAPAVDEASAPPPPVQQRSAAPTNVDRAAPLPKQAAIPDATARIIPKPRAPDAPAPSHVTPSSSPTPEPQAPPSPATSLSTGATAGFSGVRGLLVILPTSPSLSDPATTDTTNAETRPTTGILSFEPSASPD